MPTRRRGSWSTGCCTTPSEVLRDLAAREGDAAAMEALLRRLFRLEGEEDEG